MRVNVYTEELTDECEIVTATYKSSRTGEEMVNYGLRFIFKSHSDLHFLQGRDDDRSAVTFWCGEDFRAVERLLHSAKKAWLVYRDTELNG